MQQSCATALYTRCIELGRLVGDSLSLHWLDKKDSILPGIGRLGDVVHGPFPERVAFGDVGSIKDLVIFDVIIRIYPLLLCGPGGEKRDGEMGATL